MQREIEIKKDFSISPQNFYVYLHVKESNGEVFYVGKGTKHRWRTSFSRSLHWKNTARKNGVVCKIISHNLTAEEALILEKKLIASYGRQDNKTGCLVNLTDGGDGVVNYVWTDEHRKKISEAGTGRKHTEEFKKMISAIHKGKKVSQTTRQKISKARKGKPLSEKQLNAIANRDNSRSRPIACIETCKIYSSISEAASDMDLDSSGVSKVCYGKRKHYKGYHFKFIE